MFIFGIYLYFAYLRRIYSPKIVVFADILKINVIVLITIKLLFNINVNSERLRNIVLNGVVNLLSKTNIAFGNFSGVLLTNGRFKYNF